MVQPGPERRTVREMLSRVDARGGGQSVPASSLSGGNQQKLLFARSLLSDPTVLIADEPTRGVDVGAKRAIYELLTTLTADGLGILLISSDVEEILGLAHRVLVMRGGRVVTELTGEDATEAAILGAAFGASTVKEVRELTQPQAATPAPEKPEQPGEPRAARRLALPGGFGLPQPGSSARPARAGSSTRSSSCSWCSRSGRARSSPTGPTCSRSSTSRPRT